MKRTLDLLVATMIGIMLIPIIIIVAILVRLKLGAPVLFKQERPGLHGKPFILYKFRTMTRQRNESGELLPDHLRLTPLGKRLRKLSIDELPQLINVFKGEVSLVGPRPLLMEYLPLYSPEQTRRHEVKPGITGWAQVNGRNEISWEEKFNLDVWYVDHQSFLLDCKILWLTLWKVLRTDGVSSANHVTMPVFKGRVSNHEG